MTRAVFDAEKSSKNCKHGISYLEAAMPVNLVTHNDTKKREAERKEGSREKRTETNGRG
jgi:uncharacterized DUF497 family protein